MDAARVQGLKCRPDLELGCSHISGLVVGRQMKPWARAIVMQPKSSFDLRKAMDEGKILLVNLAKGRIGEDTAGLLGSLLVSRIGLAGLSRADTPEDERRDFHVYLDEFQNFTTLSLANMLSELRKYRVNLVLAHQYLSQLEPEVRDAILGNTGTIISFRLGVPDAEILAKEFYPDFSVEDLINLPNYQIYLKLRSTVRCRSRLARRHSERLARWNHLGKPDRKMRFHFSLAELWSSFASRPRASIAF
jgi:hypothetical protein